VPTLYTSNIAQIISHVSTTATQMKLLQQRREFRNYFKVISATMSMSKNIHELE